jgi:hypothetical protein
MIVNKTKTFYVVVVVVVAAAVVDAREKLA